MQQLINGITHLPEILKKLRCKRLFLVAGDSYKHLNINEIINNLSVEKIVKFSGFTSNPIYEQVCAGIKLMESSCCDTILAVGGGSAIDVAKCIKLAILTNGGDIANIPPSASHQFQIISEKIPLIAIPTTAGTGSESTHNAVIYYAGKKQTVVNEGILPNYAILETSVLKTLPVYQKKCTMMDALCQGIESWWSVNSTEESKRYSQKCVSLIMNNWEKYIFENDNDAASQIMLAANYSGRAINIAQTTAAHAMSYKITSSYGLPHGHAVAICLPEVWQYMTKHLGDCTDFRGRKYLENVFTEIAHTMGAKSVNLAIILFRQMMQEMKLSNPTFRESKETELRSFASSVNPLRLKNTPFLFNPEVCLQLYARIIK